MSDIDSNILYWFAFNLIEITIAMGALTFIGLITLVLTEKRWKTKYTNLIQKTLNTTWEKQNDWTYHNYSHGNFYRNLHWK